MERKVNKKPKKGRRTVRCVKVSSGKGVTFSNVQIAKRQYTKILNAQTKQDKQKSKWIDQTGSAEDA